MSNRINIRNGAVDGVLPGEFKKRRGTPKELANKTKAFIRTGLADVSGSTKGTKSPASHSRRGR